MRCISSHPAQTLAKPEAERLFPRASKTPPGVPRQAGLAWKANRRVPAWSSGESRGPFDFGAKSAGSKRPFFLGNFGVIICKRLIGLGVLFVAEDVFRGALFRPYEAAAGPDFAAESDGSGCPAYCSMGKLKTPCRLIPSVRVGAMRPISSGGTAVERRVARSWPRADPGAIARPCPAALRLTHRGRTVKLLS